VFDGRDLPHRVDGQEFGLALVAGTQIEVVHLVVHAQFLEQDPRAGRA
jgi:hypothetical protein